MYQSIWLYVHNEWIYIYARKDRHVCISVDMDYNFKNKTINIKCKSVIKTHKDPKWLNFYFPKSSWFMINFCICSNKIEWLLISTSKLMALSLLCLHRSYGSALSFFLKKTNVWISRRCQYFIKFGTVLQLQRVNSMYFQQNLSCRVMDSVPLFPVSHHDRQRIVHL